MRPVYTGSGSGGRTRTLHDISDTPIALWQLEEDLLDASGNGKNLTPVNAVWGTGFIDESKVAWDNLIGGASKGTHAHDAVFTVLGALTFATLILPDISGADQKMISYTNGGGGADNMLYQLDIIGNTLRYNHQNGGGNNNTLPSTYSVQPWRWNHVGFTRDASGTTVKLFVNGKKVATSGPFANPPDGGANSTLNVMGYHGAGSPWLGGMQSAILIGSEISEANMLAMSNARFGIE